MRGFAGMDPGFRGLGGGGGGGSGDQGHATCQPEIFETMDCERHLHVDCIVRHGTASDLIT